ncbi:MAG: hypothetical protein WDM87_16570 [Terracidiphilus sp.]
MPGTMLAVRYADRRLGRIVEDIGSQSPEGSLIDQFYNGGIANVSASTDISVNENEAVLYSGAMGYCKRHSDPGTVSCRDKHLAVTWHRFQVAHRPTTTSVANGDFFRNYNGSPFNGACITNLATAAGGAPGRQAGWLCQSEPQVPGIRC